MMSVLMSLTCFTIAILKIKTGMTWRHSTEKDLIKLELTWGEAEAHAKDRTSWRNRMAVFSGLQS